LPAKISKMECQQSLNTAPFETQPSEASSSKTPLSEISPFLSETSFSEKRKKVVPDLQHMLPIQNWN